MKISKKAGAIVISKENPENILLLYRAQENDWTFPKGHLEGDETNEMAAIREVKEETGLTVDLLPTTLPPLEYDYPNNGGHCIIVSFLAKSTDDSKLTTEKEGDKLEWVHYLQIPERLSYDNLRELYQAALPQLEALIIKKEP